MSEVFGNIGATPRFVIDLDNEPVLMVRFTVYENVEEEYLSPDILNNAVLCKRDKQGKVVAIKHHCVAYGELAQWMVDNVVCGDGLQVSFEETLMVPEAPDKGYCSFPQYQASRVEICWSRRACA